MQAHSYPAERSWWSQFAFWQAVPPQVPRVSFADLTRIHFEWRQSPTDEQLTQRYERALRAFESRHGQIDDAYWCLDCASGAAITINTMRSALGIRPRYRFHRVTAWATQPDARVARLLNASDELGVRVSQVLRGTSARVCMGLVMNSSKNLLALVDAPSQPSDPAARNAILKEQEGNLKATEREYRLMATRQAQLVYVAGAIAGAIVLTVLVLFVLWLISLRTSLHWLPSDAKPKGGQSSGVQSSGVQSTVSLSLLYLCAIAGGLGAIVSLIARINTNSCTVDYEAGRGVTFTLGALRPALGAVFGIAIYAAVFSGVLELFNIPKDEAKQFYFFLVIAFLAGFSERWARDMLIDVGGTKPLAASAEVGAGTR